MIGEIVVHWPVALLLPSFRVWLRWQHGRFMIWWVRMWWGRQSAGVQVTRLLYRQHGSLGRAWRGVRFISTYGNLRWRWWGDGSNSFRLHIRLHIILVSESKAGYVVWKIWYSEEIKQTAVGGCIKSHPLNTLSFNPWSRIPTAVWCGVCVLHLPLRNVVCSTFRQRWYWEKVEKVRIGSVILISCLAFSLPCFVRLRYLN